MRLKAVWFEVFVKCCLRVELNQLSLPVSVFIALSSVSRCAGLFCPETIDSQQLDSVNTASFLFLSIPCYQFFGETTSVSTCVGLMFENLVLSNQSSWVETFLWFLCARSTCLKSATLMLRAARVWWEAPEWFSDKPEQPKPQVSPGCGGGVASEQVFRSVPCPPLSMRFENTRLSTAHHRCSQVCPSLRQEQTGCRGCYISLHVVVSVDKVQILTPWIYLLMLSTVSDAQNVFFLLFLGFIFVSSTSFNQISPIEGDLLSRAAARVHSL